MPIGFLDNERTQRYHWVVIPNFDENGNLPPGIHDATIEEVQQRYSYNKKRVTLFTALLEVVEILRGCACPEIHLDGSFITAKEQPGDYDLCYESTGITPTQEFYEFLKNRETRKERYMGDIFARMPQPPYYFDHVQHWQTDSREDDIAKGIIRIRLEPEEYAQE